MNDDEERDDIERGMQMVAYLVLAVIMALGALLGGGAWAMLR